MKIKMTEQNSEKLPVRILALACSPSKGFNSDTMLEAFLEGVREVKGIEVEKLY
jgi:multimeric flavodoxin WrbA